jgi:hypothetical protein
MLFLEYMDLIRVGGGQSEILHREIPVLFILGRLRGRGCENWRLVQLPKDRCPLAESGIKLCSTFSFCYYSVRLPVSITTNYAFILQK